MCDISEKLCPVCKMTKLRQQPIDGGTDSPLYDCLRSDVFEKQENKITLRHSVHHRDKIGQSFIIRDLLNHRESDQGR